MSWNYANLAKEAKTYGGPEAFKTFLKKTSKAKGRRQMIPWIIGSALSAGAGVAVVLNHQNNKSMNK